MYFFRRIIPLSVILFLTSCAVGPDYVQPSVRVPSKFKEAKNKSVWKVAQPQDEYRRGQWWLIFNEPKLNELENRLNQTNQTIMNAYYNYKQACALIEEAQASFFPTLTGSLNFMRQKNTSGSTAFINSSSGTMGTATTGGGTSGSSSITNTHTWLLGASWEPDIWGLVRRTVEASATGAQASAALYASTRLSLQATLAQTYFQLRGLDAIQKLLDDTVVSDKKVLRLTQYKYKSGVAARSDIVQAQSVLEAAQAQAINNGILRGQYEHAIATLIGIPPSGFSLVPRSFRMVLPAIPLAVPSTLLERRPDIAQAERLVAQANAQIGVAVAAYFPALTLTGAANAASQGFGHLTSIPSLSWSLGTQMAETILDGGLRSATVKAAKAGYAASVANYRQIVLAAFQDVEDNLVSLRILNSQVVVEKKAVASAQLALKLVINQYKSGTVDYSSVMTAQINAFTAQQNAINTEYLRIVAAVSLVRALGGSWVSLQNR